MTSEQNKAIVRRFWKAFEANDQAALREVLAPEMVAQSPSAPGPSNREMHLQGIACSMRRSVTGISRTMT